MRRFHLTHFLPTLLLIASQILGSFVIHLCIGDSSHSIERVTTISLALVSSYLLVILVAPRIPNWIRKENPYFLRGTGWGLSLLGLVAVALGIAATNLLSELLQLPDLLQEDQFALAVHPLGILSITLLAPLGEELLFREATLGRMLRNGIRPWPALLASSLLFGVVHLNPAQIFPATLIGLLLGILYYRTGSLLLPTLLHSLNNGMAVMQVWSMGEEIKSFSLIEWLGGPLVTLPLTIALTVGCVVLLRLFWQHTHPSYTGAIE